MTQHINGVDAKHRAWSPQQRAERSEKDQADGLRRMVRDRMDQTSARPSAAETAAPDSFPLVLSVTSGKGGVGKTNVVGNLAIAFSRMNKRVLILDGDLGLANIDIIFGLHPEYTIKHVINGEMDLRDVIVRGPENVAVIPASSGLADLAQLTQGQKLNLLSEFDGLDEDYDVFLIDTGAGISSNIVYFNAAARERIIVATPEPTSITDAYALMKVMFTRHGARNFKLLVNMAANENEANLVYNSLSNALLRFLRDISLEYLGCLPKDDHVPKAVRKQQPVLQLFPSSPVSLGIEDLAKRILAHNLASAPDGNIKFFFRKLVTAQ